MTDTWSSDPRLGELLTSGDLVVEGRIPRASNATLRCRVEIPGGAELACVYKPVAGERPLWDFPDSTLARRELAAYALSEALGWHLVPPTVWRDDGPAGEGMCQLWIDVDQDSDVVGVVRRGDAPRGWRRVLVAADEMGTPIELVHADLPALQRIALFDAVANNADRKAGHLLVDSDGAIWAIDHGVTFAEENKLRTVVWGWAGDPIEAAHLADLVALERCLAGGYDPVDQWLDAGERRRMRTRLRRLIAAGTYPEPGGRWPAIPWPVF